MSKKNLLVFERNEERLIKKILEGMTEVVYLFTRDERYVIGVEWLIAASNGNDALAALMRQWKVSDVVIRQQKSK